MKDPEFNDAIYRKNLELLSKIDAVAVYKLELTPISNTIEFCKTEKEELNLCRKKYSVTSYFHSEKGAMEESKEMVSEEIQEKGETLFVYGIGLGYIYEYLLPWLDKNKKRNLIFLEDDLEVIYYFLQTERATRILQDPRVAFFTFNDYSEDYIRFQNLLSAYIDTKVDFLALPLYASKKAAKSYGLYINILYDQSQMTMLLNEYLTGQAGFMSNFYRNLFYLPNSYLAHGMFQQFKNIPVIICGAGPSIHKNIHLLKTLKDKAVIFAGGSSLNVLNSFGINPHFGIGVDPNREQKHRLMTNDSFHLPYLFRPRVSHEALTFMQGPKIYVSGSDNLIAQWFEKEIGINIPLLDEGHNVINLCTEIAHRMGFNPIIYVGMDLAYTEVQTYATGITTHPLWIEKSHPYATEKKDAILRPDIFGEWIKTKWDWVGESNWLSHFAAVHPDVQMINATEGGLGFSPVPNIPLKEVIDLHLNKTRDLVGLVHTEIQNNPLRLRNAELIQTITKFKSSLDSCLAGYRKIIEEKTLQIKNTPENLIFETPSTIRLEGEIESEIGYRYFARLIEGVYSYVQRSCRLYKKINVGPFLESLTKVNFIASSIKQHIDFMIEAFQFYLLTPQPLNENKNKAEFSLAKEEIYSFEDGHLKIYNPEIDLKIDEVALDQSSIERQTLFYENGQLKQEFFVLENQLHGPSRYYSPSGQLLSESWYYNDKQEGKSIQYYASGALASVRQFKNNLLHGPQEYFYENGVLTTSMNYFEGLLHGIVRTFTEEEKKLREIGYKNGKRNGTERMWYPNGQLVIECQYEEGIPTGEAKEWTPTGWIFKEVNIHHYPENFDMKLYNKEGKAIQVFETGLEDYSPLYEEAQKRIKYIEKGLTDILTKVEPYIQENIDQIALTNPVLHQQILEIKTSQEQMSALKQNLEEMLRDNLLQAEEAKRKMKEL